jgi:hypothetical protein
MSDGAIDSTKEPRIVAWAAAMTSARELLRVEDAGAALRMLERAHILGQQEIIPHLKTHLWMLRAAWASKDTREICGQVFRLFLTPIGHLTGRLPAGNTGRSNVSAFLPMSIPADMAHFFDTPSD